MKINLSQFISNKYNIVFKFITDDSFKIYDYLLLKGGRSSAKGTAVYVSIIIRCITRKTNIRVYAPKKSAIRNGVYNQVKRTISLINTLSDCHVVDYYANLAPMRITFPNGSIIDFDGLVDGSKGVTSDDFNTSYDIVVFDELAEFKANKPFDVLEDTIQTFLREDVKIIFIGNPPKNKKSFFNKLIERYQFDDTALIMHTTCLDIPRHYNSKQFWRKIEYLKLHDFKRYEHEILGLMGGVDGLIFPDFDEENIIKKLPNYFNEIIISCDYGQQNATTFVVLGYIKGKIIYITSWSHSGSETKKQMAPSLYALKVKTLIEYVNIKYNKKIRNVIIDPSASGLKEEIKSLLPHINFKSADNRVLLGIERTSKLIINNELIVYHKSFHFDGKKTTIKKSRFLDEVEVYEWNEKSIERGIEEPIKMFDHEIDAVRYGVMYYWRKKERFKNKYEKWGD